MASSDVDVSLSFERKIDSADQPEAFSRILAEVAAQYGLTHFTLMDNPRPKVLMLSALIHHTTLPQPFIESPDQTGLLHTAPWSQTNKHAVTSLQWTLDEIALPNEETRRDFYQRMRDMKIEMGTVFVYAVDGQQPMSLHFFGNRERIASTEEASLRALAEHAMRRYGELKGNAAEKSESLSARETEVVRWTAEGKTSHEIGNIIGLSDHTVNAYLANAIRKMDCVNRAQLVATAIRLGVIN